MSKRSVLIRNKYCVLNFTAVRYSLHKCSETTPCCASPFTCHLFSAYQSSWKPKKFPPSSSCPSLKSFPTNIVKHSETLIIWRASCYTQPCVPPGSLNRVPASAGVKAGKSPLPSGR